MRLWPKSNYRKLLDRFSEIERTFKVLKETIYKFEDMEEDKKEIKHKENKLIAALESENKMLRNELAHKNRFIESLLSQMLGGMSIKPLATNLAKEPEKLSTTMSAAERYKAAKTNGKSLPLP